MKFFDKYLITLIISLIIGSVTLTAYSQEFVQPHNEEILEKDFTSNNLSNNRLETFELRAKQKVGDFINYLEIISDKSYDLSFREYAIETALKLFSSKNCMVNDFDINTGEQKLFNIKQYLLMFFKSKYSKINTKTENISIVNHLENNNSVYVGTITYSQNITGHSNTETVIDKTSIKKIGITLKKVEKKFGNHKKNVWEVMLCNIEKQE
jgi:hypothetical protein